MKDVSAAALRLRQSNPVPEDAFGGAATDNPGQAAFERIIASAPAPPSKLYPGRRSQVRPAVRAPGRRGRRLALRLALPVTAAVAAAGMTLTVTTAGVSTPSRRSYTFDAFLTISPRAHSGDVAAVLRQLAARAAAQPAQALGPVEHSSFRLWSYVGDRTPRNLNYFTRHSSTYQEWVGLSGASAARVVRDYDGKVFASSFKPFRYMSGAERADLNPASLPATPSGVRRWILAEAGPGKRSFGYLTWQTVLVADMIRFMTWEPLPPAVRSAMLRELAEVVGHPGDGYTYVYMGTATDHLGRRGLVIGQEQADSAGPHYVGVQSLIFDPRTGALLDVANAQCEMSMGAIPTSTGQCVPVDYTEFSLPRAVSVIPRFKAHIGWMVPFARGPWE